MYLARFKKIIFIWVLVVFGLLVFPVQAVFGQTYYESYCCNSPIVNPRCVSLQLSGQRPEQCAELYCETNEFNCSGGDILNTAAVEGDPCDGVERDALGLIDANIFNVSLRFDSDRAIQQILFVVFNGLLALSALVAIFTGVGAAIERATAEGEDKIAETTKKIQNAFIGFTLVILSAVIAQIIAGLVGVGSIFEIQSGNIIPETGVECP